MILYYFNINKEEIYKYNKLYPDISFIEIPKVCEYAHNPTVFFYKVYAINDCINKSNKFIYSDATNVFNRFVDINAYLIDDSLFLQYNNKNLLNKFWTTEKCFKKINCDFAKIMPQYWAGFQCYKSTKENKLFVKSMYDFMLDPEIAMPDTSIKKPDGLYADCIEHRQDQSVLSLLIYKNFREQKYNHEKQQLFGDWQTFKMFDSRYEHNLENCCLSSRESKMGYFRFL